jgi:hypothetical protein
MRDLTPDDIIFLGQVQSARQTWQHLHDTAFALYGPNARFVTFSHVTVTTGEQSYIQGPELIVCDAAHHALPFDSDAPWWQTQDHHIMQTDQWQRAHLDAPIGASLPEPLRTNLQAYVEATLGIEFLQVWESAPPLVMTADLADPPALPFHHVQTDAGQPLDVEAMIQAGQEWERHRTWARVREYAHMLYGPQAVRMAITTLWVYNDSSYDERPFFHVLDADERQIPYDLTLPWWQRFGFTPGEIAAYVAEHQQKAAGEREPVDYDGVSWEDTWGEDRTEHFTEAIGAALNLLRRDLLGIEFGEVWEYTSSDETDYDLLTPPSLSYPHLLEAEG